MAVKYRLIERKNLGNDKTETPKKQYAQVVYGDLVESSRLSLRKWQMEVE